MKKIQFILTLFCVLALLPACNDDEQGRLTALPSVISDLESTDYTLPKFVEGQRQQEGFARFQITLGKCLEYFHIEVHIIRILVVFQPRVGT